MPVTAAIVGSGWGCSVQVPAFRRAGIEPVALVTRKGKEKASAFGLRSFASIEELEESLSHSGQKIDIISIVTPPRTHLPRSTVALRCCQVVLCEKPTALNAAEANSLEKAAMQSKTSALLIDHELRFLPAIRIMRALVAAGYCGTVVDAWAKALRPARVGFGGGSGTVHGWHNWWSEAAEGGGTLGAICSHQFDTLSHVLGFADSEQLPEEAAAAGTGATDASMEAPSTNKYSAKCTCCLRRAWDRRPVPADASATDTSLGAAPSSAGSSAAAPGGSAELSAIRLEPATSDDAATCTLKVFPRAPSKAMEGVGAASSALVGSAASAGSGSAEPVPIGAARIEEATRPLDPPSSYPLSIRIEADVMHAGPRGGFGFGVVGRRATLVYEGGRLVGYPHAREGGAGQEGNVLFETEYYESDGREAGSEGAEQGGSPPQRLPKSDFATATVHLARACRAHLTGLAVDSGVTSEQVERAQAALAKDACAAESGIAEVLKRSEPGELLPGLRLDAFQPADFLRLGASAARGAVIQRFLDACRKADAGCTWEDVAL